MLDSMCQSINKEKEKRKSHQKDLDALYMMFTCCVYSLNVALDLMCSMCGCTMQIIPQYQSKHVYNLEHPINNIRSCSSFYCCENIFGILSRETEYVFISCCTHIFLFNNTMKSDSVVVDCEIGLETVYHIAYKTCGRGHCHIVISNR